MDLWRGWHLRQTNFVWDVMNYYSYLPAKFCNQGSFDFKNGHEIYLPKSPKGEFLPKVTYGMSLLYSPFFALGYKIAYNEKEALDGFSPPFSLCIHWGSILYGLLGLIFLRNLLIRFFDEWVTAITLAIVFFGTTLFYYTMGSSEMAHSHLFFLISAFLLLTYQWNEKRTWMRSIGIGILLGIISLIRPTEILVGALFLFWGVHDWESLKAQLNRLWEAKFHLILMGIMILIAWLPQFLFWKEHTGNYFFFSYGDERFFWKDPQLINILFSYRKGWLTYSPLIWLLIFGFFFMKGELSKFRPVILFLLILNVYMLSCWWDWFFGGGFGARGFTQHIAYLSLPIGALCHHFLNSDLCVRIWKGLRTGFMALVFAGITLSVGQSYQYAKTYIHFNSMSKDVYWLVWGKYYLTDEDMSYYWRYLKEPNYEKLRSGEDRDQ